MLIDWLFEIIPLLQLTCEPRHLLLFWNPRTLLSILLSWLLAKGYQVNLLVHSMCPVSCMVQRFYEALIRVHYDLLCYFIFTCFHIADPSTIVQLYFPLPLLFSRHTSSCRNLQLLLGDFVVRCCLSGCHSEGTGRVHWWSSGCGIIVCLYMSMEGALTRCNCSMSDQTQLIELAGTWQLLYASILLRLMYQCPWAQKWQQGHLN